MNVKRYVGQDLKEILKRIKGEYGNHAVILHSRFVKKGGWLKYFGKDHFEVIVGTGFKIVKDFQQDRPEQKPSPHPVVRKYGVHAPSSPATASHALQQEIEEIKTLVKTVHSRLMTHKYTGASEELSEEYFNLTSNLVSDEMARKIIGTIQESVPQEQHRNRAMIRETVRKVISAMVRSSDGIELRSGRCVRVAFIGPTGVGKTTTIAKLLSIYAIKLKKEVGVITTDTKRIGATDQIKRVAHLVGVPIRVVALPSDIPAALDDLRQCDVVLIDTAGRAQGNAQKMDEMREILKASRPDETHLVLDITKNAQTLGDTVEKFSSVEFNKVVLTKLDEAVKVGLILDVMSKVDKQLSFVTVGQEIPRDIEVADSGRLTQLILGEHHVAVR